ncbi:MAG: hypothetical protein KJO98_04760 [Rhodothermia bacterium]|nr:hypothetical protein [Rhodothermia bacterium]
MRVLATTSLVPIVAVASIGYDIILITPDLAEKKGFAVAVTKESPYLRVAVTYPQVIDSAWEARYAVVSDTSLPENARFFVQVDFDADNPKPIRFTLTEVPESLDAQVDIHYVCVSEYVNICEKGAHAVYHLKSTRELRDLEALTDGGGDA